MLFSFSPPLLSPSSPSSNRGVDIMGGGVSLYLVEDGIHVLRVLSLAPQQLAEVRPHRLLRPRG
eukprot:184977-Prorocentrum_minimum.AAC.1